MENKTQLLVWQKTISLILTFLAVGLLSNSNVIDSFVVLGQGHFLAAYYYRFKAKKFSRLYLTAYPIVLVSLFAIYYFFPNYKILEAVTSIYFVIHFLVDEIHISDDELPSRKSGLLIVPFLIMYVGYIMKTSFGIENLEPYVYTAIFLTFVSSVQHWRCGQVFKFSNLYVTSGIIASLVIYFFNFHPTITELMATIILLHYSNWYIHYFFHFRSNPQRCRTYLIDMFTINALVIFAFVIHKQFPHQAGDLNYFFSPEYFYIWTLMHLIFSTRKNDFGFLLRSSKS